MLIFSKSSHRTTALFIFPRSKQPNRARISQAHLYSTSVYRQNSVDEPVRMSGYAAETERLFLERLSLEKHLDDFHELWNNDQAVLWSSKPAKKTLEESKDWMVNFILPTEQTPDIDKFALLLKDEKNEKGQLKMVGFVGTNRWCAQGMDVGYCLNIAYWNRGYATEGMRAFLDIFWSLPERKNIERLVAKTHPENTGSQRVCLKSGARKGEVIEKNYERFVDKGVKSDVWLFYFDRPGVAVKEVGGEEKKES